MSTREKLLKSIASTISDYRDGEVPTMGSDHVEEWVQQFNKAVQEPVLAELDYVLKRTYISGTDCRKFLSSLIKNRDFANDDPCKFWRVCAFLTFKERGIASGKCLRCSMIFCKKYVILKSHNVERSQLSIFIWTMAYSVAITCLTTSRNGFRLMLQKRQTSESW